MKARTETRRVVDVAISGGSTLRIALAQDAGAGDVLVISHGFGGGDRPFTRPDYCGLPIRLPAEVLTDVRAALDALAEGSV